jgi:hypothetical protein
MASAKQTVRIKDEEHLVSADDIIAVARRETPRRLNAYFVEIEGRRFPPKQLLRGAIRTAQSFDTGVAVRALKSLGFTIVEINKPTREASG